MVSGAVCLSNILCLLLGIMSESGQLLNGQKLVAILSEQLFRGEAIAVHELHQIEIAAVHPCAAGHGINGHALCVLSKRTGRLVREKIADGASSRSRPGFRYRFRSRSGHRGRFGLRSSLLLKVGLNIFFAYLLNLIGHEVEQSELSGVVGLFAASRHEIFLRRLGEGHGCE